MSDTITEKDIEDASTQALNNYGKSHQVLMSTHYTAAAWTHFTQVEPTYTLGKVFDYFIGLSTIDMDAGSYELLREAAIAFHNIGFDPKPYHP